MKLKLKSLYAADWIVTQNEVDELLEATERTTVHVHDVVLRQQQVAQIELVSEGELRDLGESVVAQV